MEIDLHQTVDTGEVDLLRASSVEMGGDGKKLVGGFHALIVWNGSEQAIADAPMDAGASLFVRLVQHRLLHTIMHELQIGFVFKQHTQA